MAPKTYEDLIDELNDAVRNGDRGKTKAEDLRMILTSLIKELTTQVSPTPDINVGDTSTVKMTKDSLTKAIKADLIFSSTAEINLKVDIDAAGGLQGELAPGVRNNLPIYIDAANDGRFLFYSTGKTYAFIGAAAAVTFAKEKGFTGVFKFFSDVTDPLELLDNCTYDMTGFDSVINKDDGKGNPNFIASSLSGGFCRTSLKIRRIICNGNANGSALTAVGSRTEVSVEGDIILDTSGSQAMGIGVYSGAKLRYRGNIDIRKTAIAAVYQFGDGCVTDFVGNITTNTTSPCDSISCIAGALDFTGRIDVLGSGSIAQFHPSRSGNHSVRLNLSGATSKDRGLSVNNSLSTEQQPSSRLYIKGLIDMRGSTLNDPATACGMLVNTTLQMNIQFENLIILTKSNIPPLSIGKTSVPNNFPVSVIGSFYATQAPQIGEFNLQKVTAFNT